MHCAILGHRYRFTAANEVMAWSCSRCGHEGGRKRYPTAADAARYAAAFDRGDGDDLGQRAPLVGLLPLRIARALRNRGRAAQ